MKKLLELLEKEGHETALEVIRKVESGELNAVFRSEHGFTGNPSLDEQIEAYLVEKGASIIGCEGGFKNI